MQKFFPGESFLIQNSFFFWHIFKFKPLTKGQPKSMFHMTKDPKKSQKMYQNWEICDGIVLLSSSSRFFCWLTLSMVQRMRSVQCLRRCGTLWQSSTMTSCFTAVRSSQKLFFNILLCRSECSPTLSFQDIYAQLPFLPIGIQVEEEAEEEEVDTSLRGRLLSLVDKIKSLRKKKEEEQPETEEEPKPSKSNSKSFVRCWIWRTFTSFKK